MNLLQFCGVSYAISRRPQDVRLDAQGAAGAVSARANLRSTGGLCLGLALRLRRP